MAATFQSSGGQSNFSASSLSANMTINAGSNVMYVAIIVTAEISSDPKSVVSVIRAGQSFTEQEDLRQDFTVSSGRFPRKKVFVYYLVDPEGNGFQAVLATLSGTAAWASMVVFEVHNAYQGSPFDYKLSYAAGVSGEDGFSTTMLNTETDSIIVGSLNLFKASSGGNGFNIKNGVNMTSQGGGSNFSTFWTNFDHVTSTPAAFETTMGMGWDEVSTGNEIFADYIYFGVEVQSIDWTPSEPGVDPDAEGLCTYVSKGQVRKMINTVTGLDHLEGETIKAQMDGNVPKNSSGREVENAFLVTNGTITLPKKAAVVHAGLGYDGIIKLLKTNDGSQLGTAQAKMRRLYLAVLRLYKTLGLQIGIDDDHLDTLFSREQTALFTGDMDKLPNTTWKKDTEFLIKQEKPLPAYILATIARSEVEEKL